MSKIYIFENSEKKFFVGEDIITKLKNIEFLIEINGEEVIIDIFEKIRQSIVDELKPIFAHFYRTKNNLVMEIFKEDKNVLENRMNFVFDYTEDDFIDNFVTDKDFDFCKKLYEDSFDWELLGKYSPSINSYISEIDVKFLLKVSFFQKSKILNPWSP
jgi:hypothetical protein